MPNYIAIDGGTTNTRLYLVINSTIVDVINLSVGAKKGIETKKHLKNAVKEGILALLSKHNLQENDIERILASGMITSEFGLHKLEHISVPAGLSDLHNTMEEIVLNDISSIPFIFIRGVKTNAQTLENADMMRGEETELLGIMEEDDADCTYILPGSHSKIIHTDKNGRIVNFSTMLTGEMFAAISQNTILKDAVSYKDTIDNEYLLKGYEYCNSRGINEALFKVRVLKNIFNAESTQIYSFYMGIILHDEVCAVISQAPSKVKIGGKKHLKEALYILLKNKTNIPVSVISDDKVASSTCFGMLKIYNNHLPTKVASGSSRATI